MVLIALSLLLLVFYRSDEAHGPDAVGIELIAILLPLCVAFLIGLYTDLAYPTTDVSEWYSGYTAAAAIIEVILYVNVFMP